MNESALLDRQDPDIMAAAIFERVSLSLVRPQIALEPFFNDVRPIILPNRELVSSWHIGLIFEYLTAVDLGQILRLDINIPPRHLKSSLVTVTWPTWSWTEKPWLRWIFSSYAASLSERHSMDRRRIIQSPYYANRWGDTTRLEKDQNRANEFQNTQGGHMIATSVTGGITGKGGDRIVVDDQINPEQAESKAERERAIRQFQNTLVTRLDDKKHGAIVIVEQRTHHLDLTATVLKEGGWEHLCIPAEAPARTVVKFPLSGKEIVREIGDVICPEREDKVTLSALKKSMGSRGYAAQYLQDPHAKDSGYFHVGWWKYFNLLPFGDVIRHWSWDTAMEEGEQNDYTVGILFAHGAQGTFVEHVVRGRYQYPELKKIVMAEWLSRPANALLIEDKVSGKSLAQDLMKSDQLTLPVIPVKPAGDKVFRAALCSPYVEARRVHLLEGAPWVADFLEETSTFPQAQHDDQVDAFSQGMNYFYLGAPRPISSMAGQNAPLVIPKPEWL